MIWILPGSASGLDTGTHQDTPGAHGGGGGWDHFGTRPVSSERQFVVSTPENTVWARATPNATARTHLEVVRSCDRTS